MLLFIIPILIHADTVFAKILDTYIFSYINFDLQNILTRLLVVFFIGIFTWTVMIILNNLKPFENNEKKISLNIQDLSSSIVLV